MRLSGARGLFRTHPVLSSWLSAGVFLGLGLLTACGKIEGPQGRHFSSSCRVAPDQLESFLPQVSASFPMRVQVDTGFNAREKSDVEEAVAIWNAFTREAFGKEFFQIDYQALSADLGPKTSEDCSFSGGSENSFSIIREHSKDRWQRLGLSSNNPAVTLRCSRGENLLKQVVMVNLTHTRREQLTSIMVHELGHAVGLDHSCAGKEGSPEYASCANLAKEHPYRLAVMYPTLRVGNMIEVKENLQVNDMERANCLYGI